MTAVLLICAVPPTGKPLAMIAADSKELGEDGKVMSNKAKKIFKAGNAYMSTSGSVSNEYREDLARVLGELPKGTLEEKMEALQIMFSEDRRRYSPLELNVGLIQFDINGNPQMGICHVSPSRGIKKSGPFTYTKSKSIVEHLYFGEAITDQVNSLRENFTKRITKGKVNKTSIENASKWFIREVAKIYPETVNAIVQTKTLKVK